MNTDKIITFFKFIRMIIEKINKEFENKIISFKDILYFCLYMNGTSCSYSLANIHMNINDIIDVSDTALKNMRNKIDYTYFKQISDTLIDYVYKDNNEKRIIGIDGTYTPLSIRLKIYGFEVSKTNTYCIGLITSLFDINKKLVINYNLRNDRNERNGLMDQVEYLREGDILVMDRGYFSRKLIIFFNKLKIDVIMRMMDNSLLVKEMIKKGQTSMITKITDKDETIRFRIITYKINDKDYYLGTTIMNKTIPYFKDIYWKRWSIEINFRESKYFLSLSQLLSKSINKIQQDIYCHNILFIIHSYLKNQLQLDMPVDKFINSKNLMYLIINNLLYPLIYQNMTSPNKKNLIKYFYLCRKLQLQAIPTDILNE